MSEQTNTLAVLTALSAQHGVGRTPEVLATLRRAGIVDPEQALNACVDRGWARPDGPRLHMTADGGLTLLQRFAEIEAAMDNSPTHAAQDDCPSLPWLTTVQTVWIDAISINYAVDPALLAPMIPAPLRAELFHGTAWVQLLMSSVRDLRPQGLSARFGVSFYQVSYRAAVTYRSADGEQRRGGYFVRSESNHSLMRAIGNALTEFKFHDFGPAHMLLVRDGAHLTAGIDPERPHGRMVGHFDTTPIDPPTDSVWADLESLQRPLVECYDVYGVDASAGWLYTLTIDRDPWNAQFVTPTELYCEYFETGPLSAGARMDSVLHISRCGYRWRPLRREPIP